MTTLFDRPWLHPELADPDGLAGVGGVLNASTLLLAYADGVFPWFNEYDPILWWSPDPRGIFELGHLHIGKRFRRTLRSHPFRFTINRCFREVMMQCGENRPEGTWVLPSMLKGYCELHRIGHAHSLEVWENENLVGGIYGVSLGGLFSAESMFHRVDNASKIALVMLEQRLRACGYKLFDTQMLTPHTASLGAVAIPRTEYLKRLKAVVGLNHIRFS